MSTTGQVVGGITGAAVGFVVGGGPTGAIYGAQIGMSVGGLLDPPKGPTVEGPRLGDLSVQTSTYGQFIPRTYGTIGLSGNVFWLENNKIKEVVKKKKSGGKGGGSSSTVKTYTYFATFAVGLCEGPIAGVRRIWVGPDLVYDAGSDDLETIISSNNASSKFTIYTGTDTQQPDPRMQAEMGVANCPAFRGLAYIVVKDLNLTNYGNSVAGAQVKVEVVNSETSSQFQQVFLESTPIGINSPNTSNSKIISSSLGRSGGLSFFHAGDTYSTGINPATASGRTFTQVSGGFVSGGSYFVSLTGTNINPIPGDTQNGGVGLAGISSFYLDGAVYNLPSIGQFYSKSNSKYFKSGSRVHFVIKSSSFRIVSFNELLSAPYSSIILAGSQADAAVLSDGRLAVIYTDGKIEIRSYENPSVVEQTITSLPAVTYLPTTTGIYGSNDGFIYVIQGLASTSKVYKIDQSGAFKILFAPFTINPSSTQWAVNDGIIYTLDGIANTLTKYALEILEPQNVALSDIFVAEAKMSSIVKAGDIDATGLTDSVTGFKVTATGSIRNAIEPLRGAWPFDVVQSGYKIKATSRGLASVVTIPIGELAIDTQLTESREMDSQLPQNVTVKYIDRERDYDANEQRAQRDNTEAVNSLVLELPVVLSATQSAQVADKLIRIYALEKSDFSFTLPAPYRYLEPGDVVTIAADDADYVLRLVSVNQTADGRLECAGRPSSASTYTSIVPGDGGQQGGTIIPLTGATVGIIIDCPVIDEGLQDAPGFAVGMNGYSAGWPGGILYRTADNGQTWDDLQALEGRATAGFAAGVLAASAGNLIQRGGSLTVSLIGGTLESVTEAQMLNGANIAVYGINGRWEILRFQNATLNGDGTYTLDTFWRGDKGTEWATGLHAANDLFVLMTDPDLAFVGMPTDSIGQPRDYRAVTAGADIDSAASQSFTYAGVNLETLSGVHPRGSRSAGDLTITWQRRTRVGGAWRDNVDASLGESAQAYEVDIMQGAVVKRTLTSATPSVLYTSAQQVADFGSAQTSVTVNIYQLSSVVGRGYPLGATL